MKSRYRLVVLLLVLVAGRFAVATPLDDYVKAPDDNYSFSVVSTIKGEGYTAYVLDMTSQAWRSRDEVDRTIWKHWLTIVMPDQIASNKALLGSPRQSLPILSTSSSINTGLFVLHCLKPSKILPGMEPI